MKMMKTARRSVAPRRLSRTGSVVSHIMAKCCSKKSVNKKQEPLAFESSITTATEFESTATEHSVSSQQQQQQAVEETEQLPPRTKQLRRTTSPSDRLLKIVADYEESMLDASNHREAQHQQQQVVVEDEEEQVDAGREEEPEAEEEEDVPIMQFGNIKMHDAGRVDSLDRSDHSDSSWAMTSFSMARQSAAPKIAHYDLEELRAIADQDDEDLSSSASAAAPQEENDETKEAANQEAASPRSVRFGKVHLNTFRMTLGRNPSTHVGVPVELSQDVLASEEYTVDLFDQKKALTRDHSGTAAKKLSEQERLRIAKVNNGFWKIRSVLKEMEQIKRSRRFEKNRDSVENAFFRVWQAEQQDAKPQLQRGGSAGARALKALLLSSSSHLQNDAAKH